jgi:ribonuclease HI
LKSLLSRASAAASSARPAAPLRIQSAKTKSAGSGSHQKALLFSDGASRGNPGPAAIGFLLQDSSGNELAAEGECIGTTTNNVAEYQAVLAGLRKARELGIEELEIRLDSELVVRQLNGDYRVRHPGLIEWKRRVDDMLRGFRNVHILHVDRNENAAADKLANEALDRQKRDS